MLKDHYDNDAHIEDDSRFLRVEDGISHALITDRNNNLLSNNHGRQQQMHPSFSNNSVYLIDHSPHGDNMMTISPHSHLHGLNVMNSNNILITDSLQQQQLIHQHEQALIYMTDLPQEKSKDKANSSNHQNADHQKRPRANLSWNVMFDLLVQYGLDHNDHNVPKSGVVTLVDGSKVNLGQWLKSQRKLRRNGKLQPQRQAMLQTLIDKGTLFWDSNRKEANDDIWERNYQALISYAALHHHCNVPSGYVHTDGDISFPLGTWLKDQHKTKRANKLGSDRAAKFQRLIDDGLLAWEKDGSSAARIAEGRKYFTALLHFGAAHDSYNVPLNYIAFNDEGVGIQLGKWLRDQRQAHRAGKLPFETLSSLQQLVNQGKLSWDDDDVRYSMIGQIRHISEDIFDMDHHPTKLLRMEDFNTEISDAAHVVASMGHIEDAMAYAEDALGHIV